MIQPNLIKINMDSNRIESIVDVVESLSEIPQLKKAIDMVAKINNKCKELKNNELELLGAVCEKRRILIGSSKYVLLKTLINVELNLDGKDRNTDELELKIYKDYIEELRKGLNTYLNYNKRRPINNLDNQVDFLFKIQTLCYYLDHINYIVTGKL